MFSENIINLTCCIIIKMLAFRVDKFSAGRTKCRSSMLKRTWWNSLALFLIVRKTKCRSKKCKTWWRWNSLALFFLIVNL